MITYPFEYTRAASLNQALSLLAEGAKPLAGGVSLVASKAAPEKLFAMVRTSAAGGRA